MTQLSEHFTREELIFSVIALRHGVDNTPNDEQLANLGRLANLGLEPARAILGCPLHSDSGFRSPLVNTLIGSTVQPPHHSAHLDGLADDFIPIGVPLRNAFDALRTNLQYYDQIIIECGAWIHLAIPAVGAPARREQLLATLVDGKWQYSTVT